jgi:hypothetical protein
MIDDLQHDHHDFPRGSPRGSTGGSSRGSPRGFPWRIPRTIPRRTPRRIPRWIPWRILQSIPLRISQRISLRTPQRIPRLEHGPPHGTRRDRHREHGFCKYPTQSDGRFRFNSKCLPNPCTGRRYQSLHWASLKFGQKTGFSADRKSSITQLFGYQTQLLRPEMAPAWPKTPPILFLAPGDEIPGVSRG